MFRASISCFSAASKCTLELQEKWDFKAVERQQNEGIIVPIIILDQEYFKL